MRRRVRRLRRRVRELFADGVFSLHVAAGHAGVPAGGHGVLVRGRLHGRQLHHPLSVRQGRLRQRNLRGGFSKARERRIPRRRARRLHLPGRVRGRRLHDTVPRVRIGPRHVSPSDRVRGWGRGDAVGPRGDVRRVDARRESRGSHRRRRVRVRRERRERLWRVWIRRRRLLGAVQAVRHGRVPGGRNVSVFSRILRVAVPGPVQRQRDHPLPRVQRDVHPRGFR